jgi:hypothetical protein
VSMHRADHIAIAKAIRDTSALMKTETVDTQEFATALAKVCAERTPKTATFDREMFMAYAMSPVIPGTE